MDYIISAAIWAFLVYAGILVAVNLLHAGVNRYKVHYSVHGSGHDTIVLAESSDKARYTVQSMIPDAAVTGAFRVK
jgi:hypothetical protein